MSCQGIFGTPPEPVFNMKGCCLSSLLLEELLITQATCNEHQIQRVSPNYGAFKCGQLAECIFIICEKLRQPPETRFLAVELFDRFVRAHVLNLRQKVNEKCKMQKSRGHRECRTTIPVEEWKRAISRLCKQTLPFMVSCVQIASKLCSHYKVVTCRRCASILQEKGHRYSTSKVLTSELLVMKTLNYSLHVQSPLSYVETLLEIMGHNNPETQVKVIHDTCLRILDVTYIKRREMYSKLLRLAVGLTPMDGHTRTKFAAVENDLMLLATAIIGAAAYFIDRLATDKVHDHLARITRIPVEDIADFSSTIISVIAE